MCRGMLSSVQQLSSALRAHNFRTHTHFSTEHNVDVCSAVRVCAHGCGCAKPDAHTRALVASVSNTTASTPVVAAARNNSRGCVWGSLSDTCSRLSRVRRRRRYVVCVSNCRRTRWRACANTHTHSLPGVFGRLLKCRAAL